MLFILCFVAILSAMSIELKETIPGLIEYRIEDRDAYNSSLVIVVLKGNTQHAVYRVEEFNGLHSEQFQMIGPGTYTVTAYSMDTGNTAESEITISPQKISQETKKAFEEIEKGLIEEQAAVALSEEQTSWLTYLIVGLFIVIVIMLLFGNPLKKPKKKK